MRHPNKRCSRTEVDKQGMLSYIAYVGTGPMEEKLDERTSENAQERGDSSQGETSEEKKREVDLNTVFPGREYDLNRLFPDETTKKLLYEAKRNKRDIERFIKNLHLEDD